MVGWSGTIKPEAGEHIGKERNGLGSAQLEQKDDFLHLHGQWNDRLRRENSYHWGRYRKFWVFMGELDFCYSKKRGRYSDKCWKYCWRLIVSALKLWKGDWQMPKKMLQRHVGISLGTRNHLAVLDIMGLLMEVRLKKMISLFPIVAMIWPLGEGSSASLSWSRYSSGVLFWPNCGRGRNFPLPSRFFRLV